MYHYQKYIGIFDECHTHCCFVASKKENTKITTRTTNWVVDARWEDRSSKKRLRHRLWRWRWWWWNGTFFSLFLLPKKEKDLIQWSLQDSNRNLCTQNLDWNMEHTHSMKIWCWIYKMMWRLSISQCIQHYIFKMLYCIFIWK